MGSIVYKKHPLAEFLEELPGYINQFQMAQLQKEKEDTLMDKRFEQEMALLNLRLDAQNASDDKRHYTGVYQDLVEKADAAEATYRKYATLSPEDIAGARELTANLVSEHLDVDIIKEGYDDKLYSWEDQQLSLEGQLAGIQTSYQTYLDSMFIANPSLGYDFKNDDGRVDTEEEICDSMTAQTWCNATSECCLPNQLCSSEKGCYFPDNGDGGGGSLPQTGPNGLVIME